MWFLAQSGYSSIAVLYHMVHTIRVWYIPYAYGMYRTRMVQFCIPYAYGTYHTSLMMQYVQIACHACLNAYSYSFFIYGSILLACSCMQAAIYSTYIIIHSFSMQPSYRFSYILVVATYNITLKINLPFIKCRSTSVSISVGPECMVYSVSAL